MTNRERAKEILGYRIDVAGSQAAKDQPLIEAIERALDEKDAECQAKIEEYKSAGAQLIMAAHAKGQREMREGAALESFEFCGCEEVNTKNCPCVVAIRALPIEGE